MRTGKWSTAFDSFPVLSDKREDDDGEEEEMVERSVIEVEEMGVAWE